MADDAAALDILALTAQIVSAHVKANSVSADLLPDLIRDVHRAVSGLGVAPAPAPERPQPAVPVKKSVFPDYIVCLEDGKKLKMLKRHLMSSYKHDARPVSGALGPRLRLSDGGAKLRAASLLAGQKDRVGDGRPRHGLALPG